MPELFRNLQKEQEVWTARKPSEKPRAAHSVRCSHDCTHSKCLRSLCQLFFVLRPNFSKASARRVLFETSASRFPVRSPDSSISPVPLSRPTRHPLPSPTWDARAIDKGDPSRHIHCELAFVCPSIVRQTGVEATVTPPPEHHTRTAPQPQPSQNSRGQSPPTPTRPPANTGKHTPPASTARCERRAKRGGLYRFRS